MHATTLFLPGLRLLRPDRFADGRGFFSTVWSAAGLAAAGIDAAFVQDNQSVNLRAGTVRGLHFQRPPAAQGKLVRVGRGRILDVAVDLRRGSPEYGRHAALELSAETGDQLWVPRGFAHGFVTLEDNTEVLYKCDAPWSPRDEGGLAFDDPTLGIDWGVDRGDAELSEKDRALPGFDGFESPFVFEACEASGATGAGGDGGQ